MAKRTHRVVVVMPPDETGRDRFTSKSESKAKAEKIAAQIRVDGFGGKVPESVTVVPVSCSAVQAIMLGAMR